MRSSGDASVRALGCGRCVSYSKDENFGWTLAKMSRKRYSGQVFEARKVATSVPSDVFCLPQPVILFGSPPFHKFPKVHMSGT